MNGIRIAFTRYLFWVNRQGDQARLIVTGCSLLIVLLALAVAIYLVAQLVMAMAALWAVK